MIVKEPSVQMVNNPPYFCRFLVLNLGVTIVTANVTNIKGGYIAGPAWSPDGRTIFYTRVRFEKEYCPRQIVALDLETRKERELYPGGSREGFLTVSPGGRQLAFIEDGMLKVIPTEGDKLRTLLNMKDLMGETGYSSGPFAWTPDGRYVLFVTGPLDMQPDSMVSCGEYLLKGAYHRSCWRKRECFILYIFTLRVLIPTDGVLPSRRAIGNLTSGSWRISYPHPRPADEQLASLFTNSIAN